jgi:hypothetical protein
MKKLFLSLAVAGMFVFFACGPSAEEQAEQAKQDSIRIADSMAVEQAKLDSIAEAAKMADSTAVNDSVPAGK